MRVPLEMPTILLVEDSDEDADTVATAFARFRSGGTLHRVTSGDACIAWLKTTSQMPALVIMDLNMHGLDGRQALCFIKSDPSLKAIPVVILSTSSRSQDRTSSYLAGANAYHVKSVRYPDHLQTVDRLLQYWLVETSLPETGRAG